MWNAPSVKFRRSLQVRWLAVALTLMAIGLAACGDDEESRTTAASDAELGASADPEQGGEPILIKTQLNIPVGEVLSGSSIGDSAFCGGGKFRDSPGEAEGTVEKTFRCTDGTLTISFTPSAAEPTPGGGASQQGPWKVVDGTGSFEGLSGSGRMKVEFESVDSQEGRETFTGTVVE